MCLIVPTNAKHCSVHSDEQFEGDPVARPSHKRQLEAAKIVNDMFDYSISKMKTRISVGQTKD
jgi:hypothetical protein